MPEQDTLKAIGFRGTPRWWIEKNQKVRMGSAKPPSSRAMDMPSWWPGQSSTLIKAASNYSTDSSGSETGSDHSDPKEARKAGRTVVQPSAPMASSTTPPPATSKVDHRAGSDDSGDLIDFDIATTASTSPSASLEETLSTPAETGKRTPDMKTLTETKRISKATSPRRVFVPAGESPEAHIAQVRKRNIRPQAPPSRSEVPSLQKHIQSLQKSKYGSLMASKHVATASGDSPPKEPQQLGRKRVPKRDRAIPFRSPAPVVVNLPGAEKSAK
jgi:hypothetical protein